MYKVVVDYSGNVVFKNHMYAVIHYVMTEVMTLSDESSKFIDVISNFHRLEHISCLGSACKMRTFLEFPFHQIRQYDAAKNDVSYLNTTQSNENSKKVLKLHALPKQLMCSNL